MAVSSMGGALMKFWGLMGLVSRNSLGGGWRSYLDVLVSRSGAASRLVFGTMCGMGIVP
jgi:hypothetical protein